jgi:hypothetical protein
MSNDREYMRTYMLARYHRRRLEIIAMLGGKCARCPATEELEIDHADPSSKKINIAKRLSGLAKAKLDGEIKKCQLLCDRCHNKKSLEEQGGPSKHGTCGMYVNHRCRCRPCKDANNESSRKSKKRRKERELNSRVV